LFVLTHATMGRDIKAAEMAHRNKRMAALNKNSRLKSNMTGHRPEKGNAHKVD